MISKEDIRSYFESLRPDKLGLKNKIKVQRISKLGMGTGNLNFLVKANDRKYVFRINMNPKLKKKSRKEFQSLKIIEKYNIGPKPRILDESCSKFDSDLMIIDYIEGKTCDKLKGYLGLRMIRNLGRLCGKMHSVPLDKNLKKLNIEEAAKGYRNHKKLIKKEYLDPAYKRLKNKKVIEMLKSTYDKLKRTLPSEKFEPHLVLSQGDFCEQNIIVYKGEYKLIDFEDLELTDNASEIAHIFVDFGTPFDEKQKKAFLEGYFEHMKNPGKDFLEKIKVWMPLKQFTVLAWAIDHALKVQTKQMHHHFIEENDP
ncbi:aminoglycoside phosphotransferase family protein, partial [Candidatus Woesearchaeota archaeon]|nr:aminoglycoside phosphotransferase family protein [Candidatus Woesearchaeota archaeon]